MNKTAHVLNVVLQGICKQADQTIDPVKPDTDFPVGTGDLKYSSIGSAIDRASKNKMRRMMLNLYQGPRDDAARLATHALAKEVSEREDETPVDEKSSRNIMAENIGMGTGMLGGGLGGAAMGLAYRESFPQQLKPVSPLVGGVAGAFLPVIAGAFLATIKKRNPAQQVAYDQSSHVLSNLLVPGRAVYNDVQRVRAGDEVLKALRRVN